MGFVIQRENSILKIKNFVWKCPKRWFFDLNTEKCITWCLKIYFFRNPIKITDKGQKKLSNFIRNKPVIIMKISELLFTYFHAILVKKFLIFTPFFPDFSLYHVSRSRTNLLNNQHESSKKKNQDLPIFIVWKTKVRTSTSWSYVQLQ